MTVSKLWVQTILVVFDYKEVYFPLLCYFQLVLHLISSAYKHIVNRCLCWQGAYTILFFLFDQITFYTVFYIKISLWKQDLSSLWGRTIQLRMIVSSITDTSLPIHKTCISIDIAATQIKQLLTQDGDTLTLDTILHHRTIFYMNRTSLHTSPRANATVPTNNWMKNTTCFLLYSMIFSVPVQNHKLQNLRQCGHCPKEWYPWHGRPPWY